MALPRRRFWPEPDWSAPAAGFSLAELLVTVAVLLLLAAMAIGGAQGSLATLRVESAARRVLLGLSEGRACAERRGEPCALSLTADGWQEPATGSLPACREGRIDLTEAIDGGAIRLVDNLPELVRFSSNGLVLDGGTVVLSADGTELRRCLVMALPLGVVRLGRYGGDPGATPISDQCRPDPTL
ncbi:GspH/FimT family protein [Synechococcus sp. CBW1002]|jgi:prepilin-type N-terminal cleavage/methylation domain-containing protein|uniref:GspH/FimT family protein n=1 Tax=Synechococcus sp. CBW1002 TaxID=1353134 RepID=UPI0018CE62D6|nr:GspH/FimT family protein [Synechococcus sp. CBW1002]QPN58679.1 GspH/FimT family protein [Synechococcus sp. CBW1002]